MNLKENYAQDCHKCKKGHFATVCQSGKKPLHVSKEECYDVSEEEAHAVSSIGKKSNRVLLTCLVNKQHEVMLEIDTGASCSVLCFYDYVRATVDKKGENLKKTTT